MDAGHFVPRTLVCLHQSAPVCIRHALPSRVSQSQPPTATRKSGFSAVGPTEAPWPQPENPLLSPSVPVSPHQAARSALVSAAVEQALHLLTHEKSLAV